MGLKCFACSTEIDIGKNKIGFREDCPKCSADLHACKNCQFYDSKAYNDCRETSADVVKDKDRANYCEFFQPQTADLASVDQKAKDLMAAAEALFKKS